MMASRVRAHLARAFEWWAAPVLYAVLVAFLYRNLWHDAGGRPTAFAWDVVDTYGPNLESMARELASGSWSLWNPYDKGGYPTFCDPQVDRFYPLTWPFVGLGAALGSPWWLIHFKVLAHRLAAALTMHGFLRSRSTSVGAACVGATSIVVCVPALTDNLLWPMVWIPLVWTATDALVDRPTLGRGAALACALYLVASAGSPPGIFYSLLLTVPYGLWRVAAVLIGSPDRRAAREYLARLGRPIGAAVLLTASLSAVIWIPVIWFAPQTARAAALGREWALAGAPPAWPTLVGLLVPGHGAREIYVGVATLGLVIFALVRRPRHDGGILVLFGLMGALGIVLCLGEQTPVLPWLVDHVPGFRTFRIPRRYTALIAFSCCAAAGMGTSFLLDGLRQRSRAASWACAAVLMAFVAWDVTRVLEPNGPVREPRRLHRTDVAALAEYPGIRDSWRIYDEFVYGESVGLREGVRDFRGYPAVDPLSLRRYVDILELARKHPEILEAYNVRWVFHGPHFRFGASQSFLEAAPDMTSPSHFVARRSENGPREMFEASHPVPLIVWYGAVREVQDPRTVLGAVLTAENDDGSRDRAVVETPDMEASPSLRSLARDEGQPAIPSRVGTLIAYHPDRIEATVSAPTAGLVVLNELFMPGWQVSVDGRPAVEVRANYLLRAVVVDAGPHRIVWELSPPWFWALLLLWVVAMGALVVLVARGLLRRGHPASPATGAFEG
jgi:hypothetical protein